MYNMESWCCTYIYVLHVLLILVELISGQTVVEGVIGGSVVLPCTLKPQGDLQWNGGGESVILIKPANGKVIIPGSIWKGDVSLLGESDLEIRSLRSGRDEGKSFTCSYSGGKPTQQIQIKLLAPITGVQIAEASNGKVTLTAGTPKTLTCSVSGDPTTPIYYTWEVNGNVASGQNNRAFILIANRTMKMTRCRAYNRYRNGTELSAQNVTAALNVLYLNVPVSQTSITVTEGERITIKCTAEGNPQPTFKWLRSTSLKSESSILTIVEVSRSDAGSYTSRVNNSVGIKEATVNLTILYPPDVELVYTKLTRTLTCIAKGVPPVYNFSRWEHRLDGKLLQTLIASSTGSSATLKLRDTLTYEDMGYYICQVSNGIKSPQTGQLNIVVPTPAVFEKIPVLHLGEGGTGALTVPFYTHSETPNVTVEWRKSGEKTVLTPHYEDKGPITLIVRGQDVTISGTVTVLILNDVTLSDGGNYSVTVTNDINGIFEARELTFGVQIITKASQTTNPGDSTDGTSGAIGGAIGGSIAAVVVVIVVAIVVWKQRNRASHHREAQGSSPSTNSTSMGMNGLTDGDTVKVYDNLGTNPDYVNTVEEKTYTSLSQKEKNTSDVQRVGVMSIQKGAQSSNDTQYEDMTITNKTIHSQEYSNRTRDVGDNKTYENSVVPEESQHNYYNSVQ